MGFKPTEGYKPPSAFKADTIVHSDTQPIKMAAGNGFAPLEGFEAPTDFRGLHDKLDSDNQPKWRKVRALLPRGTFLPRLVSTEML